MKQAIVVGCAAALCGGALAQEASPIGISLRLGQFQPQGRDAKDEGEQWFIGGVDFRLRRLSGTRAKGQSLSVSVDYASKGDFQTIPVLLNLVGTDGSWYFFGGVGASYTTVPKQIGPDIEKDRGAEFAYQLGIGYEFQLDRSPLFAEAKFMGNRQDKLNGFALMLGVRL